MKKKVFILLFVIISASVAFYFYAYKSHRNIADETSEYIISVENFEKEFAENDSLANLKYLDKTVEIKGKITAIEPENKALIIDEKVFYYPSFPPCGRFTSSSDSFGSESLHLLQAGGYFGT